MWWIAYRSKSSAQSHHGESGCPWLHGSNRGQSMRHFKVSTFTIEKPTQSHWKKGGVVFEIKVIFSCLFWRCFSIQHSWINRSSSSANRIDMSNDLFSVWIHPFQTNTSLCYRFEFVPIDNTQLCCKPTANAAHMHTCQLPIVLLSKNTYSCIFSLVLLFCRNHSSLCPPCGYIPWWLLPLLLLTMKNGTQFYWMLDYFHGWWWGYKTTWGQGIVTSKNAMFHKLLHREI